MQEDKCPICGGNLDGHFHVDPITFKITHTALPKPKNDVNVVYLTYGEN